MAFVKKGGIWSMTLVLRDDEKIENQLSLRPRKSGM